MLQYHKISNSIRFLGKLILRKPINANGSATDKQLHAISMNFSEISILWNSCRYSSSMKESVWVHGTSEQALQVYFILYKSGETVQIALQSLPKSVTVIWAYFQKRCSIALSICINLQCHLCMVIKMKGSLYILSMFRTNPSSLLPQGKSSLVMFFSDNWRFFEEHFNLTLYNKRGLFWIPDKNKQNK